MRLYYLLEKRLEEVIPGVGGVIMCAMVFFQVVMRYVFSLPTSWSDEIAQYCMLWSVYLSVSWAVRERAHIRVMNFINLFPLAIKNGFKFSKSDAVIVYPADDFNNADLLDKMYEFNQKGYERAVESGAKAIAIALASTEKMNMANM